MKHFDGHDVFSLEQFFSPTFTMGSYLATFYKLFSRKVSSAKYIFWLSNSDIQSVKILNKNQSARIESIEKSTAGQKWQSLRRQGRYLGIQIGWVTVFFCFFFFCLFVCLFAYLFVVLLIGCYHIDWKHGGFFGIGKRKQVPEISPWKLTA